ncbi:M50 family metallopeptidase [Nocardioides sp. GXQ0305]|uniref:M50 family metallopeptidase n=1 Tax=Nocardioides sp. GXQ0305 TaxID=3423912 RepID=UPI003D7C4583
MTAVYYTLGVVIFFVAILASIGLHEFGHMIPAKKFGGKVTQWFIGFGPTVWSKQIGETEYGLKAIPLGGYVKIVGMLPPGAEQLDEDRDHPIFDEDGERVIRLRRSNTGLFAQMVSDARAAEWEHVKAGDEDRLFYRMAWWKKVIVMAGGPTVNLLIAFFLFWGVFSTIGYVERVDTRPVVDEVIPCIVPADEDGRACTAAELRENPTPARVAGLEPGDRFVSFNGEPVSDWEEIRSAIRGNGSEPATLGIERDGEVRQVEVVTEVTPRPLDADNPGELTPVGFLGVMPVQNEVYATGGPLYTTDFMAESTAHVVVAIGKLPVSVWNVGQALVGLEERDPNGPVSVVGGGRIAGEIASSDEFVVSEKAASLAMAIATFNLFIGLFNFIPLLPLDGGHIASALWEAVRRGVARLRGRPDPGYVDAARLLPVAYVVASGLLVMGVVLILADIFVPVELPF